MKTTALYRLLFTGLLSLSCLLAQAQPALYKLAAKKQQGTVIHSINPAQAGLLFANNYPGLDKISEWLAANLELRPGIDMLRQERPATVAAQGLQVNSFFQYYRDIKVEHGRVNVTSRNSKVLSLQFEFYSIPASLATVPLLTEKTALQKAAVSMQLAATIYENSSIPVPSGELVIVRTYDDDSTVCLAWKFNIMNAGKMSAALVYVDAQTGRVVLLDQQVKHSNTPGQAATRYSGTQTIITDNANPDTARPYRLQQSRNGHNIITLNYQQRVYDPVNNNLAVDFTDNDNNWTAAEYDNANQDNAALDVQFNMQVISDYWSLVHSRNSWNNGNSPLRSYVHVRTKCNSGTAIIPLDNAFWYQGSMYFGDGSYGVSGSNSCYQRFRPLTPLDVTAHEVGHGVTESTSGLIYRWESGALNEGFSDIWGVLIEKWGVEQYASISQGKSTWKMGEEMTSVVGQGIRDMQTPANFNQPSAYKDAKWRTAQYPDCMPDDNNDDCGVHYNSGVLNKWFYLITMGESGTNTLNQPYNVTGMGFTRSTQLVYLSTLNLTPNASYNTAKAVTLDATVTLFGAGSPELETVISAWRAVGVDSAIWDMSNTPAFAANSNQNFLCISLGKNGTVWAGTDKKGLYVFDGTSWTQRSEIPNVRINDLKDDYDGGIWVAQSGTTNSGLATAGGVNYFADPAAAMTGFYTVSTQTNVPTRNIRSVFVDQSWEGDNPRVWIAANTYINSSGNSTSGKPAVGLNAGSPYFTGISAGIETANATGGVAAIGGNNRVVWVFSPLNYGRNQIIAYNAATGALIAAYDNSTVPEIPANINVKAIYTDAVNRTWFGLGTNAILVYDQHQTWHYVTIPSVFIAGSATNYNAITGSRYGDIYIGTSAGLAFFDSGGDIDNAASYRLYKKQNGLPSSNVTGIAYDQDKFKVWVATDQGICRWDPLCLGNNCGQFGGYLTKASSVASGNWSDSNIWENHIVPDSAMEVFIAHDVIVDINASCNSLKVLPGAATTVSPTKKLTVYGYRQSVIQTANSRREEEQ